MPQALSVFGSVTTVEPTRFLDIIDPRARVCELRKRGYQMATVPVARAPANRRCPRGTCGRFIAPPLAAARSPTTDRSLPRKSGE
ncbi:hypothetical protein FVF58_15595 [Paraburkholderia panacisoli]|uniref:Winged helix-turn-helix domain-containing protein n=1 Tax=Paraburkholderia panacisoli TaxID=2603818 RepID=A0A5B0H8G5_9BURK|nr:helix-turn-helix domain-containing protein [Paraburkholderia panacisoli]KAA1011496.1 hypothetical protein FVF58_15595 [Paraburkholderia panacisoli]